MRIPRHDGFGLVNLVAEVEHRLTGASAAPRLDPSIRDAVPDADTYVLVLIDGLGARQLGHPAAAPLAADHRATLDAPFPTQTSVVTSTLATGLPPSRHGLIAYWLHLPPHGVVNTLYWYAQGATEPLDHDPEAFLPAPNTAERLTAAGSGVTVVEPSAMVDSTINRVLYRNAGVRGVGGEDEAVAATLEEAARPGRLVVAYYPHVDAAAHAAGQASDLYAGAMATVAAAWDAIAAGLPGHAALLGTADHGHLDVAPGAHVPVAPVPGVAVGGDSRVLHLRGPMDAIRALAAGLPGTLVAREDAGPLWGPGPHHPEFEQRAPDALLFADDGHAFLFEGDDQPMVGHHGGLTDAEVEIPLLAHHRP
ncbi:MAG: alkaline phosphatase family protein [Actinobacteria bacterium]|nr:alkaline phosphatase family protein [Actinomycetota bacterium]